MWYIIIVMIGHEIRCLNGRYADLSLKTMSQQNWKIQIGQQKQKRTKVKYTYLLTLFREWNARKFTI